MKIKNKTNRRQIMQLFMGGGFALYKTPAQMLAASILGQFIDNELTAQSDDSSTMNYVSIASPGAPARWMYDLFLTPYSSDGFVQNPSVATNFTAQNGRYTGIEYKTISLHGINAPYLWSTSVARSNGDFRAMDTLLQNLLCIQGMNTGNAGHPGSQYLHFIPLGASKSLGALVADKSTAFFPNIAVNPSPGKFSFKSAIGKTAAKLNLRGNANLLMDLTEPFTLLRPDNYEKAYKKVKEAMNQIINSIDKSTVKENPELDVLIQNKSAAAALIEQGFGDLTATWGELLGKYEDLCQRTIEQKIVGLNDLPVGSSAIRGKAYNLGGAVFTNDLETLLPNDAAIDIAKEFALAEYVLTNSYTNSLYLGVSDLKSQSDIKFDQHGEGSMVALYIGSQLFRSISTCLLEFVDVLKSAELFDKTIIEVWSEFNRSPRDDQSGSDHAFTGKSVALYSGRFKGPTVIGDIQANSQDSNRSGTYGLGAPIEQLGRELSLGDYAATLAYLLNTKSPITSSESLVEINGDTITSRIGTTKIIK